MSPLPRAVAALVALTLATPRVSLAATDITVDLKNGASFHGELVERIPGDHVTIKLATGDIKTFPWTEVVTDAPPPTKPAVAGPVVHLETKHEDVVLEREVGSSETANGSYLRHFELVCRAPCDLPVPAGAGYRLSALGRPATKTFALDGDKRVIDARLGSRARTAGGVVAPSLGMGMLVGAAAVLSTSSDGDQAEIGYALAASGALTLAIGIAVLATNRSSVTVDGKRIARRFDPATGSFVF